MLRKIPNLESVVLRFDKNGTGDDSYSEAPQSVDYRGTILRWLSAALVTLKRPLKELGIQNHQNVTPSNTDLQQVLCTLSSLRLNVLHESEPACPENEIEVCKSPKLIHSCKICLGIIPRANSTNFLAERRSARILRTCTAVNLAKTHDGITPEALSLLQFLLGVLSQTQSRKYSLPKFTVAHLGKLLFFRRPAGRLDSVPLINP